MFPVEAIFVPFPLRTGTKLLHPRPPPQSLNGSWSETRMSDIVLNLPNLEAGGVVKISLPNVDRLLEQSDQ